MVKRTKDYPQITREELEVVIVAAQGGDKEASDEVVLRFLPLVKRVASRYGSEHREDNEHNGVLGLYRAMKTFDPVKATFSTYAYYWIKHFIEKDIYEDEVMPFEAADTPCLLDVEDAYIRQDLVKKSLAWVEQSKSPNYTKLLYMRSRGATLSEVSTELKLTKQRSSQISIALLDVLTRRGKE